MSNQSLGALGECIAKHYLELKKYTIIDTNFRTKMGEIDIIARRPGGVLTFIEVKCRIGDRHGRPYEAVTSGKLKRLSKATHVYLLQKRIKESTLAVEVISIQMKDENTIEKILHFDDLEMPNA